MKRLYVPTIRDRTIASFWKLFEIYEYVAESNGAHRELTIDFSHCGFIPQNGVAFLGGLIDLARQNGVAIQLDWDTLKPNVREHLANNGFIAAMGGPDHGYIKNTIPYRCDIELDKEVLMDYLKRDWLGRGWVNVSPRLKDRIVGKTYELYANAFDHSDTPVGVHSCGQFYPQLGELRLTVVDFGVGIANNVCRFLREPSMSDREALEWAFQEGNSTLLDGGIGRGMGLDLLRKFVHANQGVIMIFANTGYGIITAEKESFGSMPHEFFGTFVNIGFQCDERYYKLAFEDDDEPLF